MPPSTSLFDGAKRFLRQRTAHASPARRPADDPFLFYVARPARSVSPQTRVAVALEMLRMGPYRILPITTEAIFGSDNDAPPARNRVLLGVITEAALMRAFMNASPDERAALREQAVAGLIEAAPVCASPGMRAREAAVLFDALPGDHDALPVVDGQFRLLGLVGRGDLVQELFRPLRPPLLGGMATPLGVYLTTGGASGGVGFAALVLTGFALFCAHVGGYALVQPLETILNAELSPPLRPFAALLPTLLQTVFFFLFVRASPLAGYHAAEHQVVHAVERGEPLLVDVVRQMPRVHPRCGTNLAAGGLIFGVGGAFLETALLSLKLPPSLGYLLSGLVALAYWRSLGAWLQQNVTTRPATNRQLESGIRAARALLEIHSRNPDAPTRGHHRLWRAGFLQILVGFALGYLFFVAVARLFPLSAPLLRGLLQGVL